MTTSHMTIPIFLPHMGCPQACTFCNQNTISGTHAVPFVTEKGLKQQIDAWLAHAKSNAHIEIGFFGGSFTGLPLSLQHTCLTVAKTYLDSGAVQGIRLSTRPDYIDQQICHRLKGFGVTTVELGVQSLDDQVLLATKRGHDAEASHRAVAALREAGVAVGIQLMLGLPEDSEEAWERTINKVVALEPSCVRLYPALVFEGTELANAYRAGQYQPLNLEVAVRRALKAYQALIKANIPVIRMGLQASEATSDPSTCLAGPNHDSFRELVESALYKALLERDLECGLPGKVIGVKVNPKHVSFFCGHKKSNLNYLKAQGIGPLKIRGDASIDLYTYEWVFE